MKPPQIIELENHLQIKLTQVGSLESTSNFLENTSDNESSYQLNNQGEIIGLVLKNATVGRGKDYFKRLQNLKTLYFFGYSYIDETSNEDYSFLGELVSLEILVIDLFEPSHRTDLSALSFFKTFKFAVF